MDRLALDSPVVSNGLNVGSNDSNQSGVSWGAVLAGAFVAAALSLALFALGVGIGFSELSPWVTTDTSSSMIGWTAVIWLVLMEISRLP